MWEARVSAVWVTEGPVEGTVSSPDSSAACFIFSHTPHSLRSEARAASSGDWPNPVNCDRLFLQEEKPSSSSFSAEGGAIGGGELGSEVTGLVGVNGGAGEGEDEDGCGVDADGVDCDVDDDDEGQSDDIQEDMTGGTDGDGRLAENEGASSPSLPCTRPLTLTDQHVAREFINERLPAQHIRRATPSPLVIGSAEVASSGRHRSRRLMRHTSPRLSGLSHAYSDYESGLSSALSGRQLSAPPSAGQNVWTISPPPAPLLHRRAYLGTCLRIVRCRTRLAKKVRR